MRSNLLKKSVIACTLFALAGAAAFAQPRVEARKPLSPVTEDMLRNPPPADWLLWRRTYDAWGYSPLESIH